mgnify:CR=1 FL=1
MDTTKLAVVLISRDDPDSLFISAVTGDKYNAVGFLYLKERKLHTLLFNTFNTQRAPFSLRDSYMSLTWDELLHNETISTVVIFQVCDEVELSVRYRTMNLLIKETPCTQTQDIFINYFKGCRTGYHLVFDAFGLETPKDSFRNLGLIQSLKTPISYYKETKTRGTVNPELILAFKRLKDSYQTHLPFLELSKLNDETLIELLRYLDAHEDFTIEYLQLQSRATVELSHRLSSRLSF